MEEGALNCHL